MKVGYFPKSLTPVRLEFNFLSLSTVITVLLTSTFSWAHSFGCQPCQPGFEICTRPVEDRDLKNSTSGCSQSSGAFYQCYDSMPIGFKKVSDIPQSVRKGHCQLVAGYKRDAALGKKSAATETKTDASPNKENSAALDSLNQLGTSSVKSADSSGAGNSTSSEAFGAGEVRELPDHTGYVRKNLDGSIDVAGPIKKENLKATDFEKTYSAKDDYAKKFDAAGASARVSLPSDTGGGSPSVPSAGAGPDVTGKDYGSLTGQPKTAEAPWSDMNGQGVLLPKDGEASPQGQIGGGAAGTGGAVARENFGADGKIISRDYFPPSGGGSGNSPYGNAPPPGAPGSPYGAKAISESDDGSYKVTQENGKLKARDSVKRDGMEIDDIKQNDRCAVSAGINQDYGCNTTHSIVEGAKITNAAGQALGSIATQGLGISAQLNAQKSGTQSAALSGAASTQEASGMMQAGTGAINAALGIYQYMRGKKHDSNADTITANTRKSQVEQNMDGSMDNVGRNDGERGHVSGKNEDAREIMNQVGTNKRNVDLIAVSDLPPGATPLQIEQRAIDLKAREARAKMNLDGSRTEVSRIGRIAAGEQRNVKDEASAGAFMSTIAGVQQLATGYFNIKAADQLKQAANKLAGAENLSAAVKPPGFDGAFGPLNTQAAQANGGVLGSGQAPVTAAAVDNTAPPTSAGLPPGGFNPLPPDTSMKGAAPVPDARKPGSEANGGGAGAGFSPGSGTAAAPAGSDTEPQARYADSRNNLTYETGGANRGGGGGGAKGGGDGPDLSQLLAQFMPKKDDEARARDGILSFGRNPASQQDQGSLLGPGVNIFDRISKTYIDKTRRGVIGF